jgi:hypothetical protein
MKVNEYLPNLDVEAPAWLNALERFYRPYFRPFSNVISIKTTCAARKKIAPIWRTSVDDVIAWCHCKSSICHHVSGKVRSSIIEKRNVYVVCIYIFLIFYFPQYMLQDCCIYKMCWKIQTMDNILHQVYYETGSTKIYEDKSLSYFVHVLFVCFRISSMCFG